MHQQVRQLVLEYLGLVRDIRIDDGGDVSLTLVLPFPQVPQMIRDYMVNSLSNAAKSAGGTLKDVETAIMDDAERQAFMEKEAKHWRG